MIHTEYSNYSSLIKKIHLLKQQNSSLQNQLKSYKQTPDKYKKLYHAEQKEKDQIKEEFLQLEAKFNDNQSKFKAQIQKIFTDISQLEQEIKLRNQSIRAETFLAFDCLKKLALAYQNRQEDTFISQFQALQAHLKFICRLTFQDNQQVKEETNTSIGNKQIKQESQELQVETNGNQFNLLSSINQIQPSEITDTTINSFHQDLQAQIQQKISKSIDFHNTLNSEINIQSFSTHITPKHVTNYPDKQFKSLQATAKKAQINGE